MSSITLPRRAVLVALASALAAPAAFVAAQPAGLRFSRIVVGGRRGGAVYAIVQQSAQSELQALFADRLGGSARLVVNIDAISLGSNVPGRWTNNGVAGNNSDYVEGVAVVLGPNGAPLARHPILATSSSDAGGPWYAPGTDALRFDTLGRNFARWVRRTVA